MSKVADQFLATMKAAFFDRAAIAQKVEETRRKGLLKFGAFVRRGAQTSMRKRKGPSAPGQPPSSHGGSKEGLRFILFAWDPARRSVVVGPVPFGKGVPELHEFGGTRQAKGETITVKNKAGRDKTSGRFLTAGVRKIKLEGSLVYPKRPFMRPALDREAPKFPQFLTFNAGTTLGSNTRGR
ncbi:MAG: hypothetical protein Q8K72_11405 [Acidimicrobiales bacterium]|nr:hypothetical protein [Acidimicrobiales bacterium]